MGALDFPVADFKRFSHSARPDNCYDERDPSIPHSLHATLAYIEADACQGSQLVSPEYIKSFAKSSNELRALDNGRLQNDRTCPEVIIALARCLPKSSELDYAVRAEFLAQHLSGSQTFLNDLQSGKVEAVKIVRSALTSLGGTPLGSHPPVLTTFIDNLSAKIAELAGNPEKIYAKLTQARDDYRDRDPRTIEGAFTWHPF